MIVHYLDKYDNNMLGEIDTKAYRLALETCTVPRDTADNIDKMLVIVDKDPRQSDMDMADIFFSHYDLTCGITDATQLLQELIDSGN